MFDCYFTFRSITGAQRGQRAMEKEKIVCQLARSPKSISMNGCGYALKVCSADARTAAAALKIWRVEYKKLYKMNADGSVEEKTL